MPLVRIRDINSRSTKVNYRGTFDKQYLLDDGDVLIGMDGDFNAVRWAGGRALLNQRVCKITADEERIDQGFLFHSLQPQLDLIHRRTPQTTVRHLSTDAIQSISLPGVPLPQQLRIAAILDTLDDQIRSTEQMISKLKLSRDGLIVELLTKGLEPFRTTVDRRRRETRVEQTIVGPIPGSWHVASLAAFQRRERPYLKTGPFGSSLKQEHWVDEGIPVVTIGSLGEGVFIESELLHVTPKTAARLSAYALDAGDIVFSRVADVGRSVVVGDRERDWIMSSNMMWISLDPSRADPRFVRANIASNPYVRLQIRRFVNSAGRDVANAKIMNLLQFPWPSLAEQVAIVDQIDSWDEEVVSEESRVAKLQLLKQGLAMDLLTGRVRVRTGVIL